MKLFKLFKRPKLSFWPQNSDLKSLNFSNFSIADLKSLKEFAPEILKLFKLFELFNTFYGRVTGPYLSHTWPYRKLTEWHAPIIFWTTVIHKISPPSKYPHSEVLPQKIPFVRKPSSTNPISKVPRLKKYQKWHAWELSSLTKKNMRTAQIFFQYFFAKK